MFGMAFTLKATLAWNNNLAVFSSVAKQLLVLQAWTDWTTTSPIHQKEKLSLLKKLEKNQELQDNLITWKLHKLEYSWFDICMEENIYWPHYYDQGFFQLVTASVKGGKNSILKLSFNLSPVKKAF